MYRPLLLLFAGALFAACVPLETTQTAIASADEGLRAVADMAGDKGWIVTSRADTSIVARQPKSDDEEELMYSITIGSDGKRLTLNVYRIVAGRGQRFVDDEQYYEEFFDELATYR